MIADYAISELFSLVRENYPEWESFRDERFQAETVAGVRQLSEKTKGVLNKGAYRRLLAEGAYEELWERLARSGRQSPLMWTGSETSGDLAILHAVRKKGDLWSFLEQVRALLFDKRPSPDRIQAYADYCIANDLPNKWLFPTHTLFLLRPHAEMIVKPRLSRWFLQFLGMGEIYTANPSADMYERYKKNCHGLLAELKEVGASDMIDVYSLLSVAHDVSRARVGGLALDAQIDLDRPRALRDERPLYQVNPVSDPADPEEKDANEESKKEMTGSNVQMSRREIDRQIGWPADQITPWLAAIERKKQAIFYGPPGTGKTYIADQLARYIVSQGNGVRQTVQFHPAYDYADFIEGIRPTTDAAGRLSYKNRPGLFIDFCRRASERSGPSVLIIDEINRANLAQVFGELMYLLEYRNEEIELASGRRFKIPDQVVLLGTMNTADRSIALIDHALRRRFAFIQLAPNYDLLQNHLADQPGVNLPNLIARLEKINQQIGDPHFYVGVSFFMVDRLKELLPQIWRMEIEPYLEELFAQQPEVLESHRWDKISADLLLQES